MRGESRFSYGCARFARQAVFQTIFLAFVKGFCHSRYLFEQFYFHGPRFPVDVGASYSVVRGGDAQRQTKCVKACKAALCFRDSCPIIHSSTYRTTEREITMNRKQVPMNVSAADILAAHIAIFGSYD